MHKYKKNYISLRRGDNVSIEREVLLEAADGGFKSRFGDLKLLLL
jgi:hypothetical protein